MASVTAEVRVQSLAQGNGLKDPALPLLQLGFSPFPPRTFIYPRCGHTILKNIFFLKKKNKEEKEEEKKEVEEKEKEKKK